MVLDVGNGFACQCSGYFFILPESRFSAFHISDTRDTIYDTLVVSVGRVHFEQFRIIFPGRLTGEVLLIRDLNRVVRVEIDYPVIFYKNARHTVACGCHDKRIIKADITGSRFQRLVPVLLPVLVAQSEMPFAYHSGTVSGFFKHIRHRVAFRADDRSGISVGYSCSGFAPGIFSCQHGITGGRAGGSRAMCIGETHTHFCQAFYVGSMDGFGSVATQVTVAYIIRIDEDDVRRTGEFGLCTDFGCKAGGQC